MRYRATLHLPACLAVAFTGQPEDYRVSLADVNAWEAQHRLAPEGAIVLFATHRITNPAEIFHIENATNLTRVFALLP